MDKVIDMLPNKEDRLICVKVGKVLRENLYEMTRTINNLMPVRPKCHAMPHRRNPSLMVEELRNAIMEIYYSSKYGNK
jgi:hypothetical protein